MGVFTVSCTLKIVWRRLYQIIKNFQIYKNFMILNWGKIISSFQNRKLLYTSQLTMTENSLLQKEINPKITVQLEITRHSYKILITRLCHTYAYVYIP